MTSPPRPSDAVMLRLSRYHCFLGGLLEMRPSRRVTSREIADELGLSEETVRHDLKHVDIEGRPGAGYDLASLQAALQEFLDLTEMHPFIAIGSADVLRGLAIAFPAEQFGMEPVGYFSERAEDHGEMVGSDRIGALGDIRAAADGSGARIALVACAPEAVEEVLRALKDARVCGVLMLTPVLSPAHPEGMTVTYFRIPCALKSLAAGTGPTHSSCCSA